MRIVCISDTHGRHREISVPSGDVLIHAGDLSNRGSVEEIADVLCWLGRLEHQHKVFIAGNHDFLFERESEIAATLVPAGVHYLQDSGCVIEGLKFWGSPVQPWFLDWAFNRKRGDDIGKHWAQIPLDTDVLITHGPPYGKLDRIGNKQRGGCEMLRQRVLEVGPQLHVFGHLHEGYGTDFLGPTMLVNAVICDDDCRAVNTPVAVDLYPHFPIESRTHWPSAVGATKAEIKARAAGVLARQEMLEKVGGVVGMHEVAQILGLTPPAVIKLATEGRLLAFPPRAGRAFFVFPVFQFNRHQASLLPGLEEVLKELSEVPSITGWTKCNFLLSRRRSLRGKTPLALLQEGKIQKVIALAGAYAS